MKSIFNFILVISLIILIGSCTNCKDWGDNRLIDKISLLEGDKLEDRAIIYCSNIRKKCCYGGPYIVPSSKESYYKYVEDAKEKNGWIIAKIIVIEDERIEYFIVKNFSLEGYNGQNEKIDSIIQSNVYGPFDEPTFSRELEERGIKIRF